MCLNAQILNSDKLLLLSLVNIYVFGVAFYQVIDFSDVKMLFFFFFLYFVGSCHVCLVSGWILLCSSYIMTLK